GVLPGAGRRVPDRCLCDRRAQGGDERDRPRPRRLGHPGGLHARAAWCIFRCPPRPKTALPLSRHGALPCRRCRLLLWARRRDRPVAPAPAPPPAAVCDRTVWIRKIVTGARGATAALVTEQP